MKFIDHPPIIMKGEAVSSRITAKSIKENKSNKITLRIGNRILEKASLEKFIIFSYSKDKNYEWNLMISEAGPGDDKIKYTLGKIVNLHQVSFRTLREYKLLDRNSKEVKYKIENKKIFINMGESK